MLTAVDLFAGAGGCSTGLLMAATARGERVELTAVNHWPTAVATHTRNHPEPFLVPCSGDDGDGASRPASAGEPVPFLTAYYGNGGVQSVDDPLPTATTHDRFGLVQPVVEGTRLDVRYRMLQPHELAAAMSFPKSYEFAGTKGDTVKQIGNAVDVSVARALCEAILDSRRPKAATAIREEACA
jgi:site-specific DNA-cytosine methylase